MKFQSITLVFFLAIGFAFTLDPSTPCPPQQPNSKCQCFQQNFGEGKVTKVKCSLVTGPKSLYKEIQQYRGYKIDYLNLYRVQLPYLPAGLFNGTSVRHINISYSFLDNLYSVNNSNPSPFYGLENSLEEIYIEFTKSPSKWYWPEMKNLKQLQRFQIEFSPIEFIGHVFAEIGGGSLESIIARNALVYRIHPQAFPELKNLVQADFDYNKIPYLVRTMFPNPAPRLERLSFRDNKLFILNENMFENMPALKYLNFAFNDFKSFENVAFTPVWNQLQFLRISKNPYRCECDLLSLKEKLLSGSVPQTHDFEDVTCTYIGDYKKTRLRDVGNGTSRPCPF